MRRPRGLWSPEMVQRAHAMWTDGMSATNVQKMLNKEFGVTLTRSAVLGRLYRDRVAATREPSAPKPPRAVPQYKRDSWRRDDEKWLRALTMRKRGHKWPFIAAHMRIPVADVKQRLREIATADIVEGGSPKDWHYVLEAPVVDE